MDDKWRLGHTKVFFRAGAMGCVEEVREESIKAILLHIQAMCRRWCHNEGYRKLVFKKEMIPIMQRNIKKYLFFRDWTLGRCEKHKFFNFQKAREDSEPRHSTDFRSVDGIIIGRFVSC